MNELALQWGGDLNSLNFDEITYYVKPSERSERSWDEVPEEIKQTFDKLGIPEAEQKYLAGVSAQYESEVVYHNMKEDLESQGIVFKDTDSALKENEDIFREHWAKVIPPTDNKFAALNSAVWSGGSFIYVPKGVKVDTPLQAYFRINSENMGQFERTLIIVDEGAHVHYVEGCTAPVYTTNSLHSAVVEIIVKKGGYCRYTTIQNWANNVFNLVTKRAVCEENATMEWIDGNIGSKLTMKYPAVILKGEGARGMTLSIALAGKGQHQDAGAKMIHLAPNTSSTIVSFRNASIMSFGVRKPLRFSMNAAPILRASFFWLILRENGTIVSRSATWARPIVRRIISQPAKPAASSNACLRTDSRRPFSCLQVSTASFSHASLNVRLNVFQTVSTWRYKGARLFNKNLLITMMIEDVSDRGGSSYVVNKVKKVFK